MSRSRHPLGWIALSLVVVVSGGLALTLQPEPCDQEPFSGLGTSRVAFDGDRPRLTGCFDRYWLRAQAPAASTGRASTLVADAAVAQFEKAAATAADDPAAQGALAQALLVTGRHDRAVPILEQAASRATGAGALADLAAAYLIRGQETRATYDIVRALDAAARAATHAPADPVAAFNTALALEHLHLARPARGWWNRYLTLDHASGWRQRAAPRADASRQISYRGWPALQAQLSAPATDPAAIAAAVDAFPQAAREHFESIELRRWAELVRDRRCDAADQQLRHLRRLADAVSDAEHDAMARDVVSSLETSAMACGGDGTADVAAAVIDYADGLDRLDRNADAVGSFAQAEARFRAAHNPLAHWAAAHRVYAAFNSFTPQQFDAALRELAAADAEAAGRGYLAVRGRIAYLKGSILANRADFTAALNELRISRDLLSAAREVESAAANDVVQANALWRLGDYPESWNAAGRVLESLDRVTKPGRRYAGLLHAGIWAVEQHLDYAALALLDALVAEPDTDMPPAKRVEPFLHRARIYTRLGRDSQARGDLAAARAGLDGIADRAFRTRAEIELMAAEAEIVARGTPSSALPRLGETMAFFDDRGYVARSTAIRLLRGRTELALSNDRAAERDFIEAIGHYERYRRSLTATSLRVSSLEPLWDAFEQLVELSLSRGDPMGALGWAEQSRARSLSDAWSQAVRTGQPIDAGTPRSAIPEGTRVLYYAALRERLGVWALSRLDVAFRERPIGAATLAVECEAFRRALERHAPVEELKRRSAAIYEQTIAPIADRLPPGAPLVIVPDGALQTIPFAALFNARTGRYLIEDHPITIAPSLSLSLAAGRRARELSQRRPSSLLVIGDPDQGPVSDAPPLLGARSEADTLRTFYAEVRAIPRATATADQFVQAAPTADVVHFAGHAAVNPDLPLTARLEFAAAGGAPSALYADQIDRLRFDRTRLVVLAACRTGYGAFRRGEGLSSLARPFLAAGVPTVIATLWDLDDRSASELFIHFHASLRDGLGVSSALRAAQLQLLRSADPDRQTPSAWAAATTIGGRDGNDR